VNLRADNVVNYDTSAHAFQWKSHGRQLESRTASI